MADLQHHHQLQQGQVCLSYYTKIIISTIQDLQYLIFSSKITDVPDYYPMACIIHGGVLTQKIPKNPSRYTKIGKLGLGFFGIFWDFLGFLNFQIGIGFFGIFWDWDFLGFFGIFWDFLGFFGFFKFPNWDWVFLGLGFFGIFWVF